MSKPNTATVRELPSYSWTEWDRIHAVKRAIRELEFGQLRSAALLVDAMTRDDRIRGDLLKRTEALPSLPLSFEDGVERAKKLLDEKTFESMIDDAALSELEKWGVMLGIGFAQLLWETRDGLWWPKLKVWHPQNAWWNWATRSWWMGTEDQGVVEVKPGDGQWVIYAPYGLDRAYMMGAVRALYVPWLLRQWGMRDWGRWSEVYGGAIRVAKTPAAADEDDKQRFLKEVAAIGGNTVLRLPTSADPLQQYGLELVEAKSTGADGFNQLIGLASTSISICLLGQNLTSEVKGGSRAAAQVHDGIRDQILESDAQRVGRCVYEQVLQPWARFNFGAPEAAPRACWSTKPPDDKKTEGEAYKALGEGLTALRGVGAKPDIDTILERHGVPVTGPAEEPEPAPAPGDGPPTDNSGDPPKKPGKAENNAGAPRKPSGALRGQVYIDAVGDDAIPRGGQAIRPEVLAILDAVMASQSYDELRGRLLSLYEGMTPDALAVLLEKAMVMAELAGRLAVLEDT